MFAVTKCLYIGSKNGKITRSQWDKMDRLRFHSTNAIMRNVWKIDRRITFYACETRNRFNFEFKMSKDNGILQFNQRSHWSPRKFIHAIAITIVHAIKKVCVIVMQPQPFLSVRSVPRQSFIFFLTWMSIKISICMPSRSSESRVSFQQRWRVYGKKFFRCRKNV